MGNRNVPLVNAGPVLCSEIFDKWIREMLPEWVYRQWPTVYVHCTRAEKTRPRHLLINVALEWFNRWRPEGRCVCGSDTERGFAWERELVAVTFSQSMTKTNFILTYFYFITSLKFSINAFLVRHERPPGPTITGSVGIKDCNKLCSRVFECSAKRNVSSKDEMISAFGQTIFTLNL